MLPYSIILVVSKGHRATQRFSPATDSGDERTQIEEFRTLFSEAVRTRLEPNGRTWAELSGGLDSSSIVSMAQTLVEAGTIPEGVAGTISIVDELGAGNERRFSDLVAQRFHLPNVPVINPWPWQDDGRAPPKTDEPRAHYPFFARDRLICDTVRAAGAQVLLSGFGSDHYLFGSRLFIADLIGRGQIVQGGREIIRLAVQEKRSIWKELVRNAVAPFFPAFTPDCIESYHTVPDWIDPVFAKRLGMHDRLPAFM